MLGLLTITAVSPGSRCSCPDPPGAEPARYHWLFDTQYVQVVDVHCDRHERPALDDHPGGRGVVLASGHLMFSDEKGRVQGVFSKSGEPRRFPAFKHRVADLGVYVGIERMNAANADAMDAHTEKILGKYRAALKP